MQLPDTLLCFAAMIGLSAFLSVKCRINSAITPLLSLSIAVGFFTVAGVAGLLLPAAWVFLLACLGLLGYTLATSRGLLHRLLTPGFIFFAAASLVMMLYLALRQPLLQKWDEFVLWGTAVKLMVQNNTLYTLADMGWAWTTTQSPALPILGWFAQVFSGQFAPWKLYWAYDMLLFACGAVLLAPFTLRRWRAYVPVGVLLLLFPYFFSAFYHLVYMDVTYINSYGDFPSGMLFGAVLALYYSQREGRRPALLLAAMPLAMLALMKDNVFPIALVALVIMLLDTLLFVPISRKRKLAGSGVAVLAVLGAYAVWSAHRSWANALNPATGGETTGVSQSAAAVSAVKQLLGLEPKTERFAAVLDNFAAAIGDKISYSVSIFGSLLATIAVILLLFAAAILLNHGKRARLRVALAAVLSLLGFLGYLLVMLISWGFLFKIEGGILLDYDRYLSSYLAGWLLLALYMLVQAFARLERLPKLSAIWLRFGALACAGAMCMLFAVRVPFSLSVLAYPDIVYADQQAYANDAARLQAVIPEGERLFFIDQTGDGENWFLYSYHALPLVVDYSISGGGSLTAGGGHETTAAELLAYLQANSIEYVYIYSIDDAFRQEYATLFAQPLPQAEQLPQLYYLTENGLQAVGLEAAYESAESVAE